MFGTISAFVSRNPGSGDLGFLRNIAGHLRTASMRATELGASMRSCGVQVAESWTGAAHDYWDAKLVEQASATEALAPQWAAVDTALTTYVATVEQIFKSGEEYRTTIDSHLRTASLADISVRFMTVGFGEQHQVTLTAPLMAGATDDEFRAKQTLASDLQALINAEVDKFWALQDDRDAANLALTTAIRGNLPAGWAELKGSFPAGTNPATMLPAVPAEFYGFDGIDAANKVAELVDVATGEVDPQAWVIIEGHLDDPIFREQFMNVLGPERAILLGSQARIENLTGNSSKLIAANEVSIWWSALSDDSQQWLISAFPEPIGNTDGIPAIVRDRANRSRLEGELAKLLDQEAYWIAQVDSAYDDITNGSTGVGELADLDAVRIWQDRKDSLALAREKLEAFDDIQKALDKEQRPDEDSRYLLFMDFTGDRAKVAIAVGNVDTAAHVAVNVPGTGTTVAKNIVGMDEKASLLQKLAIRENYGTAGSVAVVSWIAYEPPMEIIPDAAKRSWSSGGAPLLASFTKGINATNIMPNVHLTVLGHSYGAVVVGDASAMPGTGIDDVVVFGAPGVGNLPADGIGRYSMLAPDDPIKTVHILGGASGLGDIPYDDLNISFDDSDVNYEDFDPKTDMPVMTTTYTEHDGWNQLPTGPSTTLDGVSLKGSLGHSEYYNDGTRGQFNLAVIIVGQPEKGGFDDLVK